MVLNGETGKHSRQNGKHQEEKHQIASCGSYPYEPKENKQGMPPQPHQMEKMQKPDNTWRWEGYGLTTHIWLLSIWKTLQEYLVKLKRCVP